MSTASGALAARRDAVRVAVTDRMMIIALSALVVLLAGLTWGTWGDLGSDTGYDFVASERVADGEIPYRDFPYFYGPLAPALGGLAALLGDGIPAYVGLGLALAMGIIAATYAVSRLAASPLASGLAAAIVAALAFAPSNFSFVLPHTYSATIGLLGALVFVLGAGRFAVSGSRGWLWIAGAGGAVVALARPEFTLAVWIAGGLWLALRVRAGMGSWRDLLALVAPAAGVPMVVYGAAMALTSPRELVLENLYPLEQLAAGAGEVVRISAPLTAGSFAELAGRLVLYAIGVAALVILARMITSGGRLRAAALVALALAGAAGLLALVARPELVRYALEFAYGWIPAGALAALAVLLWRYRNRGRHPWSAVAQAELLVVTLLAVIAARSYAAFFAHATVPQQAVYAIPLGAVFLAWLHDRELGRSAPMRRIGAAWLAFLALSGLVLTVSDARDEPARVSGPGGTLAERPATGATYQDALDTILTKTGPGEPVLLAPQLTSLYTLSERTNPLPQISLLPGSLPEPADERTAVRRLDEAGVNLAIVNTRDLTEYGQGAFGETYYLELQKWLNRDFTRVATFDTDGETTVALDVWTRRTQ